jgi:hypothetical protein
MLRVRLVITSYCFGHRHCNFCDGNAAAVNGFRGKARIRCRRHANTRDYADFLNASPNFLLFHLSDSFPVMSAEMLQLILGHIRAVPPSAAKSLKESSSITITIGPGLNEIDHRLLVSLFGAKERQVIGIAGLILLL